MTLLATHDIGSMAKPPWRVKAVAGRPLEADDVDHARTWGTRLDVPDHEDLVALLEEHLGEADLEADTVSTIRAWATRYGLRLQEDAGLDWVWDGEQQRSEMYRYAVKHLEGFDFRGFVRSFDNKYYKKAAVTDDPGLETPYHDEEFDLLHEHAQRPVKVPITGPYTVVDWSYDEHYQDAAPDLGTAQGREARWEARREFTLDVARDAIRPNLESLVDRGARWIQIDEPAVTTKPDEVDLFVESFREATRGLDATFSAHICFSDYEALFPDILELDACDQFALEFANRDGRETGVGPSQRSGYEILERFADTDFDIGLGVLDVHTDYVEPPELVRDRILHAVKTLGDPERVNPCPDCGLRTRTWEVARDKLANLVEGAQLAREALT